MTKKSIILISTIIISILVGLNIYMYIKSYNMSKYAEENNLSTESIVLIDKFRANINKMAQSQKLYLLTSKEEYKEDYERKLDKIYSILDDLLKSGSINKIEKKEIIISIDEYSNMIKDMIYLDNKQVISEELEKAMVESNQAQLNILNQIDISVEKAKENLIEQNNSMVVKTNVQKNGVQIITTIITALGSTILYYAKKNPAKLGQKIGNILFCISNSNNKNKPTDKKIEDIEIIETKKCMDELLNHEKNLESIKLINKESNNLSEKLKESNEIITKIDTKIKSLILDIEETKECSSRIHNDKIRSLEEELVELRILFETLPIYSGIILDISTNMKNNNNVEKL